MTSVLLIGAGPSYREKLGLVKGFKGIIIVPGALSQTMIDEGIIPHYITQHEVDKGLNLSFFPPKQAKLGIPIVYNFKARKNLLTHLSVHNFKTIQFKSNSWHNINNVGLFSAYFAWEYLKADKIYLIGFDHCGMDYRAKTYIHWVQNFKVFLANCDCEVINCTGRGKLYMKGITDGGNLKSLN